MKVCDGPIRDFEVSNNDRISINIYQVHQRELDNYDNDELDSSDDVLNKDNDLIIPIYYTEKSNRYAKHIDVLHLVDSEKNKEHFVYIKDFNKLVSTDGKHITYYCKHCVQPISSEEKLKCHMNGGVIL